MPRFTIAYSYYDQYGNYYWNTAVHYADEQEEAENNLLSFYREHDQEVEILWSEEG